jgi:hypothetical protein
MTASLKIVVIGGAGWLGGANARSILDAGLVEPCAYPLLSAQTRFKPPEFELNDRQQGTRRPIGRDRSFGPARRLDFPSRCRY